MFLLEKDYTHNAVSNMYAAKREERWEIALTDCKIAGIDWAAALIFQALHDLFQWGEGRFEKINDFWEQLPQKDAGYIWRQLDAIEKHGFDKIAMWKDCDTLERLITNRTKDKVLRARTRDMIAGVFIFTTYFAYKEYGFREKRIRRIQDKIKDYAWLLKKKELNIFEFMQCLDDECNAHFLALVKHKERYGPAFVGTKKQLKQWRKEQRKEAAL